MQGAGQGARFDMVMANPPFSTDFEPRELIDDHGRKIRLVKPIISTPIRPFGS